MAPLGPISALLGGIVGVIVYQFAFRSFRTGKRQGEFEYAYRESLTEQRIKQIINEAPVDQFDRDVSFMVKDPTNFILKLMGMLDVETDPDKKFWLHMTLASLYGRTWEFTKAMTQLDAAAALKANDLVANFRLAEVLERTGKGDAATHHYEAALDDPSIESKYLREFVASQIQRVKQYGPSKTPQYPFRKYIWG
jgi:hypothetical protein